MSKVLGDRGESNKVNFDSPSVQSYLTILQSVITRMAGNCTSCKTWCVSLVSAIVVVVADKGKPDYVAIAIIPLVLFLLLDSYYLSVERQFRTIYNDFIRKLHYETATIEDVFRVAARDGVPTRSSDILKASGSISIWTFYALLGLMLLIVRFWVL